MNTPTIFIGLMSGTSVDGIDAVAVNINTDDFSMVGAHSHPLPDALRQRILELCTGGEDSVQLLADTDHQLGELFAEATLTLMKQLELTPDQVAAIGCHGQTVRHSPPGNNLPANSLQIGDPNIIAAGTGIAVVADFRRKDMALGGQGAPLVPAFHRALFSHSQKNRVIVNIGGIANLTYLPVEGNCIGFDSGPGNVLMDLWSQQHLGAAFDSGGDWAAGGVLNQQLLERLLSCDYFCQSAPKSTGRELFNWNWLESQLMEFDAIESQDIQATLSALTASSISHAIQALSAPVEEVYICGGGAFNRNLMEILQQYLQDTPVASTQVLGIDPNWVEACAFAWLAKRRLENKTGSLASVTGASRDSILGALYLP